MTDDLTGITIVLLVIGLVALSLYWTFRRSRTLLQRWARRNGYKILEKQYRWLRAGPYVFRRSRGQTVYRIVVRDHQGLTRVGWARCGGWWLGLFSDQVDVTWEDER